MKEVHQQKYQVDKNLLNLNFIGYSPTSNSLQKSHELIRKNNDKFMKSLQTGQLQINNQQINIEIPRCQQKTNPDQLLEKIGYERQLLQQKLRSLNQSYIQLKSSRFKQSKLLAKTKYQPMQQTKIQDQKWKKSLQKRKQKIQRKKKLIQSANNKLKQSQERQQERKQQFSIQSKKKHHQEILKKIQERAKSIANQYCNSEQRLRKVKDKQRLFEKAQKKEKLQKKQEEKEKRTKLQQIRSKHQSVTLSQITNHKQKLYLLNRARWYQKQRQLQEFQKNSSFQKIPYQSHFYKEYAESRIIESKPSAFQKTKEYSKHVKQNYPPSIDRVKQDQIKQIIRQEKQVEIKKKQKQRQIIQKRQAANETLQYVRSLPKKKAKLSGIMKQPISQKPRYENYLKHAQRSPQNKWKYILNSTDDINTKIQQIKNYQHKITDPNNHSSTVDDQYYKMIKAKIALIEYQVM